MLVGKAKARNRFDPAKARGGEQLNLFSAEVNSPISVSALTQMIKRAVEDHLPGRVIVAGEISNLKLHSSGHVYFSLKDADSQIPVVMWKTNARKIRFSLQDGLAVIATGHVEVYEPHGKYQLIVEQMAPEGVGSLELAFRQLKEKLAKEGLFDGAAKKPLPRWPRTVALVTSASGAAVRDMIRTLNRRFSALRILLYPVAVQGPGAAREIAAGLAALNEQSEALGGIDLIIMGRGGGSLEDLWAFNEEVVARAIFACRIPIISAVGHETDFTIADLVADVRAATPTAGAELAVPVLAEVADALLVSRRRMNRFALGAVEFARGRLERVLSASVFRRPLREVMSYTQRLDDLTARLGAAMRGKFSGLVVRTGQLEGRLSRQAPTVALAGAERKTRTMGHRLRLGMAGRLRIDEQGLHKKMLRLAGVSPGHLVRLKCSGLQAAGGRLSRAVAVLNDIQAGRLGAIRDRLEAVGPEKVLARGYSVTMDADTGRALTDAGQLEVGQELVSRLHKGQVHSTVQRAGNS